MNDVTINEGRFAFIFNNAIAIKYDESHYYKKFEKIRNSLKAIDIIAVANNINYFIEIKDYTQPNTRSLPKSKFIKQIIDKVIYTLSAVFPMKNYATDDEKEIINQFIYNNTLELILHIELPPRRRTLEQSNYNLQDIRMGLRKQFKYLLSNVSIYNSESSLSLYSIENYE